MLLADVETVTFAQHVGNFLHQLFGGDIPETPLALYQVAARAALVYLAGLVVVRIGKSRLISRTTSLDVILGFILGSLLSRGITGSGSISGTLLASAVIVAVHWLLTAIACRSHWFGNLLKGSSELVVENGQALLRPMRRHHISDHDLIEQIRLRGVDNLQEVRAAYTERNGEISMLKRESPPRIVDVAVQNGVQTVRIALG
ncbi:MAG TPA: YetF domain-containing protein [Pirellulales bacterium]|nr:YetF domain-containing protein [Pirellulales bacterium]